MKELTLPSGEHVPAFGMGTWHIGDDPAMRVEELATLRVGLDLDARLIDTSTMAARTLCCWRGSSCAKRIGRVWRRAPFTGP